MSMASQAPLIVLAKSLGKDGVAGALGPLAEAICGSLAIVTDAALHGEAAVQAVAASSFAALAGGGRARLVQRDGREWCCADGAADLAPAVERLLDEAPGRIEVTAVDGAGTLVQLSSGSSAVWLEGAPVPRAKWPALRILATGVELALAAAAQSRGKLDALEEIRGLQHVALRILSAGDLDDILFSISQETKRLLSADICGVFLRDGDELVMRNCIGNLTRNIAKIRLLRGQGLAGRVFQTGLHCVVGDYLTSDAVSQEYAEIARAERIRSALGAPLRINDELIGVLEVWRRRRSTFTEADVRRLLALSTLTAIAIHNCRLFEIQRIAVDELTVANERLRQQNDVIRRSAAISGQVIQALLDGGGLAAISRIVGRHTDAEVTFLTPDLQPMGDLPEAPWCHAWMPELRRAIDDGGSFQGKKTTTLPIAGRWLSIRAVIAGRDHVGWLCACSARAPDDLHEITIGQAAMAAALNHLEQRAAAQARAQTLGAVALDLLEGRGHARETAMARAKELQIDLSGTLRILHLAVEGLPRADAAAGGGAIGDERHGRPVQEIVERRLDQLHVLRLSIARGNVFVAVVAAGDPARLKATLKAIDDDLVRKLGHPSSFWGVSGPCHSAHSLHSAHREAAATLAVARTLGAAHNVAVHDELGLVGLLFKVRSDAELDRFVADTLGEVLAHDAGHHGVLTKTVRAYLDCNCSQNAAARKLFVHEKTVRYRLSQFEALSGLDLARHEDRVRVDLALGMDAIARVARDAGEERPTR
jgi:sugar diacid utilization regulator/putative methionine-R-sulfoxide reductase with GAF domain